MRKRILKILPIMIAFVLIASMLAVLSVNRQSKIVYAGEKTSNPLYFTNTGDTQVDIEITFETEGGVTAPAYEYSKDKEIWYDFTLDETVVTLNKNETVYFKADSVNHFLANSGDYVTFVINNGEDGASVTVGGDVTTLIDPAGEIENLENVECAFYGLFMNNESLTLLADDFILPSTTLYVGCYESMFEGCSSLTKVPFGMLPATTLKDSCYARMFYGCSSLTNGPDLPAKNLKTYSYNSMFENCIELEMLRLNISSWGSNKTSNMLRCAKNTRDIENFKLVCPKDLDLNPSTANYKIPSDLEGLLEIHYLFELKTLTVSPTLDSTGLYDSVMGYYDRGNVELPAFGEVKEGVKVSFKDWFLRTSFQFSEGAGGTIDIRFISMLDDNLSDYEMAGFIFNVGSGDIEINTIYGHESFVDGEDTVSISDYSFSSHYFFLVNSSFASADTTVTVQSFVDVLDGGDRLYGEQVTFKISDYFKPAN